MKQKVVLIGNWKCKSVLVLITNYIPQFLHLPMQEHLCSDLVFPGMSHLKFVQLQEVLKTAEKNKASKLPLLSSMQE